MSSRNRNSRSSGRSRPRSRSRPSSKYDPREGVPKQTGFEPHNSKRELPLWVEIESDELGGGRPILERIYQGEPLYAVVDESVFYAMSLITSDLSRDCLAKMGSAALLEWDGEGCSGDAMENLVDNFLGPLGRGFVSIHLSNEYPYNGSYLSRDRERHEKRSAWTPHQGGTISLNRYMVECMAKAADKKHSSHYHSIAYDNFLVIVAVTIAHELVHCFMNYLAVDVDEDTPTDIVGIRFHNGRADSGSVWERKVLGGMLKTYEAKRHPLGDEQSGMVWLAKSSGSAEEVTVTKFEEVDGRGRAQLVYDLGPPLTTNRLRRPADKLRRDFTQMWVLRQQILKSSGKEVKLESTTRRRTRFNAEGARTVQAAAPQRSGKRGETDTPSPITPIKPAGKLAATNPAGSKQHPTKPRQPTSTTQPSASPTATRAPPALRPSPSGGGKPAPSSTKSSTKSSTTGTSAAGRAPARAPDKTGPPPAAGSSRRPKLGLVIPS
ncbi:uncharacterized protein B0H64DRAFT_370148 [Chaetomium fimeti]|uniref:Uncharacterized protein n=1 Tax=Chaetomium fimeti TaxID=1854472 RepID=A0AAE0HR25_9PEZI|nr:hypothetical protein B0H64DRAFT_370148 [Chaetomium fimeti]